MVSAEIEVIDKEMQHHKPLTLRRNFSWTFAGNVIYTACQWGMLVVLAKLGSPEMVGQFTLGLAVTAPIVMFTNLQLRVAQATDAKHQYAFGDYLGLRLISTALALLIILGITLAAGYRWETSLVILFVGLAKAFESISDIFYGLIQQHERMDRIAVSMMIKGPLSLLLLGLGVYLTHSVLWGTVGLAIAWALVLIGYDIRSAALMLHSLPTPQSGQSRAHVAATLQPRWHFGTFRKLLLLTLPLGFVSMLFSLNTNVPRYFVERYLGERDLGIFGALSYLMVAGNFVVFALGESASPRLAKYFTAVNSVAFRMLVFKLVGVGALFGTAVVLVALVAGREILTILYQPEYAQWVDVFVWLMVAAGIDYVSIFLNYGMTAARYFRIQMLLVGLVTATSAISCLWLIQTSGLRGAAIALMIAAVVRAITSLLVILYTLHKLNQKAGI